MKWQIALSVLALILPVTARVGLKTPKASAVDLGAENAALKKQVVKLEKMMKMAKQEVQRMDVMVKDPANPAHVMMKLKAAEADKKQLVQALRQMLTRNSTKIFEKQAKDELQHQQELTEKWTKERQAMQAQVAAANGKVEEAKEMVQTLQEQNMDLYKKVGEMKPKLEKAEATAKELGADKANLVQTMHGFMRENSKITQELNIEKQKESKLEKELAAWQEADEEKQKVEDAKKLKLGKLTKKQGANTAPKPVVKAPVAQARKVSSKSTSTPLHLSHEESMASKLAKMGNINRYMDRIYDTYNAEDSNGNMVEQFQSDSPPPTAPATQNQWSNDITKSVAKLEKEEAHTAPRKISFKNVKDEKAAGKEDLSNWLGLNTAAGRQSAARAIPKDANGLSPIDALDPDAVKQAKEQKDADDDDGGDSIKSLLTQAKEQLNEMDRAESPDSKPDVMP